LKLELREIPYDLPRKIYETAQEEYLDTETSLFVAVKEVKYKNKTREMALIYKEEAGTVSLITLHPLKPYQKLSRLKSGRWQKL
jgi:hypothetical protein